MKPNKALKGQKQTGQFKRGPAGCEALLYEFRGLWDGGAVENEEELEVRRVAAGDLYEALVYMKRSEEHFDIRNIQLVGIIVLLSGSPLH